MNERDTNSGLYTFMPRSSWAELARTTAVVLKQEAIDQLRGLGDPTTAVDVQEVYHPLAQLIGQHARHTSQLNRDTGAFLGYADCPTPFIVGVAGSVAVGKSTVARLVAELLRRSQGHPQVQLITTDGFLLDNATLEQRGLEDRKGFPETYDTAAMLQFVIDVKSGLPRVEAPVYSHVIYDIVPGQHIAALHPDILVLEGLNVLQPPVWPSPGQADALTVADLLDFSVYVDAAEENIRDWFVQRFLQLRSRAFADPASFFRQYADLDDATAIGMALKIWDAVNGPNLRANIAPTRQRATIILRKGANHGVESVRIRRA